MKAVISADGSVIPLRTIVMFYRRDDGHVYAIIRARDAEHIGPMLEGDTSALDVIRRNTVKL